MALFKKSPKTAKQKAQKAQMNIFVRLFAIGWLVYIIYQLLSESAEDGGINPTLRIVIVVFFICAAAVIATLTLRELFRNIKSGHYKEAAHSDDLEISDANKTAAQESEETEAAQEETEDSDDELK